MKNLINKKNMIIFLFLFISFIIIGYNIYYNTYGYKKDIIKSIEHNNNNIACKIEGINTFVVLRGYWFFDKKLEILKSDKGETAKVENCIIYK
jgi:CHASE3 domain sensor protein